MIPPRQPPPTRSLPASVTSPYSPGREVETKPDQLVVIVSDVHGTFYTLVRLLNQVVAKYPGAQLVLNGDLIDRGPNSRKVVEFAMDNSVPNVLGNHCDLALAYSAHSRLGYKARCSSYYDRDVWLWNGGEATLDNWPRYRTMENDNVPFQDGCEVPTGVLDWMQQLPAYLTFPSAPVDERGLKLLCTHNGHGLVANQGDWYHALWARDIDFPKDGWFRVFGHSPVKTAQITETFAAIDTGAAYSDRGGGNMTAFIWPTKETIVIPYDEDPMVIPAFTVPNGVLIPI